MTPVRTTKIGAPATQEVLLMEKTREVQPSKTTPPSIDVEMKTEQEIVTAEISPTVEVSQQTIQKSETFISIIDEKAIKKGKFPDYQSYKRAQDLGARNYSELEYIDRLGAPDFETAEKIRKGGFSHFQTFQKALAVGASKVSELRLVEELNAPDLVTTIKVQKSSFPDFPSYQRAQDLGASSFYEYQLVKELQAPDYETAKRIKRGKFPDYSSYKRAQDLGASNYSELEEVDHYQAPDFETVKKIRKGGFPNFQTFQKGLEAGASSFSEYISVEIPELADHKGKPSKPVAVLKEAKLDQEELEIRNGLLVLGKNSSLVGRIKYLLKQLEKRPTLSPKTIEVVKNFRNHRDVVIRAIVKRILAEKKVTITTQKVVRRVVPPLVSEIHIFEFRKKVVELGQRIGASEKDVKEWHSWLLRQTDKYQKAQIDGDFYKTMLSRFQNHYLLRIIGFKMQMHEMQALDEIRTLIDAILTGKTKLILDRAPKAEISTQDVKPSKPSKLSKLLAELLKASSQLVSSNKEVKEWYEWFLQKTDLYQKSQLDEETYKAMLKRSQNFLRSKASYSDKMQFAEVQTLDEMQALIDAILARYDEQMSKDSEKKPTSHAAPERQGKLCPSCGASIYPRTSRYCKSCGVKLNVK